MHGISIEYPNRAGDLYLRIAVTGQSVALYELRLWDPINNCVIPLAVKRFRMETVFKGGRKILNQNEFFHNYCEGTLSPITLLPNYKSQGPDSFAKFPLSDWKLSFFGHWVNLTNGGRFPFPSYGVHEFTKSRVFYTPLGTSGQNLQTDKAGVNQFQFDYVGTFPVFDPRIVQDVSVEVRSQTYIYPGKSTVYIDEHRVQSYRIVNYKIGSFTAADFERMHFTMPNVSLLPIPSHLVPSNLTDRIYTNLVIPNINNIENMLGAKQMLSTISNLKRIVRKHDLKSLAELYLMWKYEGMTTMLDLKAYWQFFQKLGKTCSLKDQIVHLSTSSGNKTTRYTISFPTYTASILESLGLNLTSANVWDTLPFSFIVDWFIGVGDTLQRIHEENVLTDISVNYCTTSTIVTDFVTIPNGPFKGSCVSRCAYNRTVNTHFPTPDIDVVFKNPIRHVFDGTALVVANKRH